MVTDTVYTFHARQENFRDICKVWKMSGNSAKISILSENIAILVMKAKSSITFLTRFGT